MRVVNAVYDCLRDGLFGRFMLSYSSEERLFRKGIIGSFFSKRGHLASRLRRVRLRLAEFFEKSVLLGIGADDFELNVDFIGIVIFALVVGISLIYKKKKGKKPSPILMIAISACLGMILYSLPI